MGAELDGLGRNQDSPLGARLTLSDARPNVELTNVLGRHGRDLGHVSNVFRDCCFDEGIHGYRVGRGDTAKAQFSAGNCLRRVGCTRSGTTTINASNPQGRLGFLFSSSSQLGSSVHLLHHHEHGHSTDGGICFPANKRLGPVGEGQRPGHAWLTPATVFLVQGSPTAGIAWDAPHGQHHRRRFIPHMAHSHLRPWPTERKLCVYSPLTLPSAR